MIFHDHPSVRMAGQQDHNRRQLAFGSMLDRPQVIALLMLTAGVASTAGFFTQVEQWRLLDSIGFPSR